MSDAAFCTLCAFFSVVTLMCNLVVLGITFKAYTEILKIRELTRGNHEGTGWR